MSLSNGFREHVLQAGQACGIPNGRLIREFGLRDFLENVLDDADGAPTIAVKALVYFCRERDPREPIFKRAVYAVGLFLNEFHAAKRIDLVQPLRDLVALLQQGIVEDALYRWIESHF